MTWTTVDATPEQQLEASQKNNVELMASVTAPAKVEVIRHPITKKKAKLSSPSSHDPVNHPEHYTSGGIETIDYMQAKLTPEEFIGYLKGNIIKYTSRAGKKVNMVEDYAKAQWYMNRLMKVLGDK